VRPITFSAAAVALGLVLGVLPAEQASADEPTPAQFRAMGHTSAPAYRLPPGCHRFHYSYDVSPPEPEWSLEVYITDAGGVAQASDVMMSGADATHGTRRFQLCSSNTAAPGRFTIRARLTYRHYATMPLVDETRDYSGWIQTSHFRVTRTRKHHRLRCTPARRAAHRACRR
jgi:hypothetical protein